MFVHGGISPFGGYKININRFTSLPQILSQSGLSYFVKENIRLEMFVNMKPVPILLSYMHIRSQIWHRCDWFDYFPGDIISLFCILLSCLVFLFSILHLLSIHV